MAHWPRPPANPTARAPFGSGSASAREPRCKGLGQLFRTPPELALDLDAFAPAELRYEPSDSSSKEEESKEKPKKNGERALVSQNLPAASKPSLSAGVIGSGQP